MFMLFAITAAIGCTVLVFQFVLTLLGVVGDSFDFDVGDIDTDVDVDFDTGGDIDLDVDADLDSHGHVSTTWLAGLISFKTIVAFLAFFGLGGLTAHSMKLSEISQIGIAVVCGSAALFAVYYLFRWIGKLRTDGTPKIRLAVGHEAKVYTTIPENRTGAGKIQMTLQNRTMEFLAQTGGPALPPGAIVIVTDVISSETVEVQAEDRPTEEIG